MNTVDVFEDGLAKYVRNVGIQEKCIELIHEYEDLKKKNQQPAGKGLSNSGIKLATGSYSWTG